LIESQLFAQEEILGGQSGSKLEETAQESDEVQTDVVKSQTGLQKGCVKYGARVPHGGLKLNTLSKVRKYLRRTGVFKSEQGSV